LYENLESTFKQIYPTFQVLLSVADADDQALDVVRKLLENYPDVDAGIVICEHDFSSDAAHSLICGAANEEVGINPKVNNLVRPYRLAKYDVLWVLDSNVVVGPNTLKNAVAALLSNSKRRVGLVHQVPFAKTFTGAEHALGSRIEEAFLNTNHAKMYMAINTVAIESCIVGKSNMFRRSDVDRLDGSLKPIDARSPDKTRKTGLEAFAKLLAEDNAIGSSLWHELDLRHELSNDVAGNVVGRMSFSAYVWRRVRWIRVRKHMVLAATLAEPFTECFVVSALGIWALQRLFSVPVWITFLMHYVAWIWVDLDVYESLAGHKLPVSRWKSFFSAWFLREALALPIWVLAMFGSDVEWRGERYRVGFNGEALRVADL
jgi:ceramide glucosyltransferase